MTTVAFLASAVDPQIASAAAKAALDEFTKQQHFNVQPHFTAAHQESVLKHKEETGKCDPEFGLDKAGIAGYKMKTEGSVEDANGSDMETDTPKENGNSTPFF